MKTKYYCGDCDCSHRTDSSIGKRHNPTKTINHPIFTFDRCGECNDPLTKEQGVRRIVWSRTSQLPKYTQVHDSDCFKNYLDRNDEFVESTLNWEFSWESEGELK